jgi:hypothetical protein
VIGGSMILGFLLIVTGFFLAYRPLGFIVCGIGLLTAGLVASKRAAK